MLLEDVEVPNETIPLSEGVAPYTEEKLLPPALEENLKLDVKDESSMFTRQRKRELEGKCRETYSQYEAISLDFFKDPSIGDQRLLVVDEKMASDSGAGSTATASATTQTESEAPRIECRNKSE